MNFSQKLKNLRIEQDLTQEKLAIGINVSRTLINKYENGVVLPTTENIQRIAAYFGVTPEYFSSNENIKERIKIQFKWFDFVILLFPIIYVIQYFIPMYGGYYYVYPIPDGQSMPSREYIIKSSFQIFQAKNIWFGWIGIFIALVLIALITFRTTLQKYKSFRYVISIVTLIFALLAFLTITFSLGFTQ
ncbi:MAG: helix-turn-helix domain-containing protein [Bacillota bacterium]|jgi:transcriptional regulator with XRE-family HTH domain